MTLYSIVHGPEVWLAIARTAVMLGVFDLGVLAGMYISALMGALSTKALLMVFSSTRNTRVLQVITAETFQMCFFQGIMER